MAAAMGGLRLLLAACALLSACASAGSVTNTDPGDSASDSKDSSIDPDAHVSDGGGDGGGGDGDGDGRYDTTNIFDVEFDDTGTVADAKDATTDACVPTACPVVSTPSTVCGVGVTIAPYVAHVGGGFQSTIGTGVSSTITVTFSKPVDSVTVTIHNASYVGNHMTASNATGIVLGTVNFPYAAIDTPYTKSIAAKGIVKVTLVPAASDYVWWDKLSFTTCI